MDRYGVLPKKSLGQHFIYDDQILARIAEEAELSPNDVVLEIGPGLGSLTRHIAERAGQVFAVELDDRLIPILQNQLNHLSNVEIVQADVLSFDLSSKIPEDYKVVGNVPYYITGAILRHFLSGPHPPKLMIITIQKEVAERLIAGPGNMSLLAVTAQFYSQISTLFTIKAGAFWPRPDVDSAVVRLILREPPLLVRDEETNFIRLVKMGFSQKRKQLRKNLRALDYRQSTLEAAFEKSNIDGRRRAETLSIDEWLNLYRALV